MTDSPAEVGNALADLDGGDRVSLHLDDGSELRDVMVVGSPEYETPTNYGNYGGISFTAEMPDAERDRLDLSSVVLRVRATERSPDEWDRASVSVYGSSNGAEYSQLGEVNAVEALDSTAQ